MKGGHENESSRTSFHSPSGSQFAKLTSSVSPWLRISVDKIVLKAKKSPQRLAGASTTTQGSRRPESILSIATWQVIHNPVSN
jgi:hypothetical protein